MEKLSAVLALYNSEAIKRATNIVVDIGELTSINVMGLKILMLREKLTNQGPYSVVFCALKPETRSIFESLGSEHFYGELVNFNSIDEALGFLNGTQRL